MTENAMYFRLDKYGHAWDWEEVHPDDAFEAYGWVKPDIFILAGSNIGPILQLGQTSMPVDFPEVEQAIKDLIDAASLCGRFAIPAS